MPLQVLSIQDTPNPNARKFILSKRLTEQPASFFNPQSAENHPLAHQLFSLPNVASVLILHDFITINRHPQAPWPTLIPQVKKIIQNFPT
jgi:hypothetical protein